MKTNDFDYDLPSELIAQHPPAERTASRLLVVQGASLSDRQFPDVLELLHEGDVLVVNNTQVIPARLYLNKATGGQVEVMLERFTSDTELLALARSNKPLKPDTKLYLAGRAVMRFVARSGTFFRFELVAGVEGESLFFEHGHMPLPPYITRSDGLQDQSRYQTVYAAQTGAVAAPTAGLHFDQSLLEAVKQLGVAVVELTLHVGAGTFQPVKVEDVDAHQMHRERYAVSADAVEIINAAKQAGKRVVAVGTTSVRALESAAAAYAKQVQQGEQEGRVLTAIEDDTQLFIYPGFDFRVVDAMITNFHLPKSTLMMMVSAFAGKTNIMAAYTHAVQQQYRFFSYGDAMWLEK